MHSRRDAYDGSRSLVRILWPFVAIVILQAALAGFSLYTLSGVRAYVGGESFWSKGQKDAVYYLGLYAETGEDTYFEAYRAAVSVPLADRDARLELDRPAYDPATAARGFIGGGNHPADTGALIWLYRTFGWVPQFREAIDYWIRGDHAIFELIALGDRIRDRLEAGPVDRADRDRWRNDLQAINVHISDLSRGYARSLGDGSRFILDVLLAANILTAAALIVIGVLRTRKLVLQRLAFQAALKAEKERAATTLASIGQAVLTTDAAGKLNYMNAAAERLTGVKESAASGKPLDSLLTLLEGRTKANRADIVEKLAAGLPVKAGAVPLWLMRPDGARVAVSVTGTPISTEGTTAGAVIVLNDMTQEQEYIARLSWQASHDSLTNLANRWEFEAQATGALRNLDPDVGLALLYLDLDQFKLVNDTCGHAAGDQLLRQVADILRRHLRPDDLLARLGGDEFGIMMPDLDAGTASEAAETLRQAVEDMAFGWNGRSFAVTASVGMVHVREALPSLEEALRAADVACYLAKEKGRNRVQTHSTDDAELMRKVGEMAWVQRIRDALDEDRFFLEAQEIRPLQPDAETGLHIELLLRLRDETGRVVPPGTFIPPAERYGLMPLIDRWVVRRAFQGLAMQSAAPKGRIATCAINLSGATLGDAGFVEFVAEQFAASGIDPSVVCFEITETSAISNLDNASRFIDALSRSGCRFSLDDFGAGMSSFAYLKHLPVDLLKIDGAFVRDMLRDPIDRAMVETIHRIGKLMGKRTIAEFVESAEIARCLKEIGVDYAQGYGVAKPTAFERFTADARRRNVA